MDLMSGEGDFYLRDGDRVVFYGDSITEQWLYTTCVETYVVTRFPQLQITFVHSGVGGDRVTGGWAGPVDLRLSHDVFAYKPTVMTIMTLKHNNIHAVRWRELQVSLAQQPLPHLPQAIEALDQVEADLVTLQRRTAQPKAHRYKLLPE